MDCDVSNRRPIIEENNPPGLVIANITTAPDVTVTIDPNYQDHNWFEINGTQLILKNSVDYEIHDVLITVNVKNLNDNPPVFKETNITVNVNEEALDYFNIQGVNNPQISLLKVLDYEKINFTELILYAMDGNANASGTHTASATINIHVIPADLRPPWFQPCTFTAGGKLCINRGYTGKVNVSENATEPLILQPGPLYAIDGDIHLNEKIVYELVGGNDDDTFSLNPDTGNITMKKPVNTRKTFILDVMAFQANNLYKYAQTTVEIKVVYKNYHEPYFEKTSYTGTVSVGLPVPSPVMESGSLSTPLKIFAVDKDFADEINPNIEYKIQNSTDFSVTADGFILTAKVLTLASTITFLAIANDKEALQETSTWIIVDVTPLATTTILPTTVTTTTATITTTTIPVTPGVVTTISKPSNSSTHLPPGTNNSQPTPPPGSTKSTTPPVSTSNAGITGRPVTSTKPGSNIPPFVTTVKPPLIPVSTPITQKSTIPSSSESNRPSETETPQANSTAGQTILNVSDLYSISLIPAIVKIFVPLLQPIDGFTNYNYQTDEKPNPDEKDNTSLASVVSENEDNTVTQGQQGTPPPGEKAMESSQGSAASNVLEKDEENDEETDSEKEVRSILTKDRKVEDDGYKAVWFKEDIVPEAKDDDVMIEDYSDEERNRDGSDGDNEDGDRDNDNRDSDDNDEGNDDNGSGQGSSSDISFIPGRAWISRSDPPASQPHEDTEERDIFL
ncbi:hypothetical protein lerEdw1_005222 [Lerista edwardsae]|nr:hypothetical protein lerEdw1_005222 [Lerista edwardsae]